MSLVKSLLPGLHPAFHPDHHHNTHQTYAEGVLLESSNAETWTPLNGSDLTMRLYGFDFQDQVTLQFQPLSGVQFSDLNIDEYSSIPEGTGIVWE
jgi:hypothetical protein